MGSDRGKEREGINGEREGEMEGREEEQSGEVDVRCLVSRRELVLLPFSEHTAQRPARCRRATATLPRPLSVQGTQPVSRRNGTHHRLSGQPGC